MFTAKPTDPPDAAPDRNRDAIFKQLGLSRYRQRRQILTIGEIPIHCELYEHDRQAPLLIFIPGIGTYSELYCELLAKLSDEGFNVLAVDPRGHGYSGGERGLYQVEQVVTDLMQVLDAVEQRFNGPVGVFGCSLGARLGLALAEQDKRISALLCHTLFLAEMPPDIWHSLGWHSLSFANMMTPDFLLPYARINFRTFIDIDELMQNNPMGRFASQDSLLVWDYPISTLHSIYSYPSGILQHALDMPAAIMVGSEDEIISPQYIETIRQQSQQPFELIVLEGGRHMLPFDHIGDTLRLSGDWFHRAFAD